MNGRSGRRREFVRTRGRRAGASAFRQRSDRENFSVSLDRDLSFNLHDVVDLRASDESRVVRQTIQRARTDARDSRHALRRELGSGRSGGRDASGLFQELEGDYGSYAHDSFIAYL
jgi:hypothetical protein